MSQELKKTLVIAAGIIFVALGLAGLALPFLQGFLFLAIGLILLSLYSPRMQNWIHGYTKRHPRLHARVLRIRAWVIRIIERF